MDANLSITDRETSLIKSLLDIFLDDISLGIHYIEDNEIRQIKFFRNKLIQKKKEYVEFKKNLEKEHSLIKKTIKDLTPDYSDKHSLIGSTR